MPLGDASSWDDCIKKRMASGKYTKEVAEKVCGKMKSDLEKGSDIEEHEPSPVKKDTKEIGPVVKAWEFKPEDILSSPRKVTGTFHVPKIDKDNEIITKAAMGDAIPDFMHLPILHDFHKERVLGVVTKVWEESDAFHFNALFKATTDVDDAWAKVQKGEYDHVSIFGARLKGNTSCGLNPSQRSVPCVSEKIRLDSISACDTNARNDSTSLVMAKAFYTDEFDIIKALSSDSGLSHGIYDGGRKSDMKVHEADGDDVEDEDEKEEKKATRENNDVKYEGGPGNWRNSKSNSVVEQQKRTGVADPWNSEEEKKAEGSPAVREDIEAKKKDFAERQAGTKRSQGEDFHGGKLEKSDELPTDEEEDFERRAHEKYGKKEVEKCGCGKGSLQKAKDGLKKIYGMLKTLTQHDKEMVEKDKEVHDSMEKSTRTERSGEQNQEAAHRSGMQVFGQPVNKPRSDEPSKKDARPRFSKGAIRPKEGIKNHKEDADVTKGVPQYPGIKHAELGDHNAGVNRTAMKIKTKSREGDTNYKSESGDLEKGVKSTPPGYGFAQRNGASHDTNKQTREMESRQDAVYTGGKVGDLNPSVRKGEVEKGIRFVDADEDDKKTYADHRKEEAPKGEVEKSAERDPPKQGRADAKERYDKNKANVFVNKIRNLPGYKKAEDEDEVEKAVGTEGNTRRFKSVRPHSAKSTATGYESKERHKEEEEVEKGVPQTPGVRNARSEIKPSPTSPFDSTGANRTAMRGKTKVSESTRGAGFQKGDNMTDNVEDTEVIEKANLETEMTDEQFVTEIVKANLKSTDEIVKAAVAAQVDEIRKGFETQIAELKAQLTKIEEQPMVKAAIIVPEDGKVDMPLNYAAVANFMKRG